MTAQFVGGFSGKDRSTEVGWTAGAGVEYGLAQGWSAWVEYLYAQLNDGSCSPTVCTGPPAATDVKFAVSMVRVGINRRW
jgi:outer membrane immunogenic protein